MKSISTKLFFMVMTFFLVVFALGTSTFAWFTLSETGEVSNIDITVGGGEGMEFSLDGQKYYSTITSDDLLNYIKSQNGKQNVLLKPITSPNGRDAYDLKGNELVEVEDGKNVNYIKLNVYFRAKNIKKSPIENAELGIFLSDFENDVVYTNAIIKRGTYIVSKGVTSLAGISYKDYDITTADSIDVNYDDSIKKYASDSMRVSFVDSKTSAYDTERAATKYYDLSYRNGQSLSNYGYGYGYSDQKENLIGSASFYYSKTGKLLHPATLDADVRTSENGFSTFGTDSRQLYANDNNSFICYLNQVDETTYEGMATMMIWLEGYDSDCYDLIFQDEMVISLNFRLAYKAR